jgi:hypothetical protein
MLQILYSDSVIFKFNFKSIFFWKCGNIDAWTSHNPIPFAFNRIILKQCRYVWTCHWAPVNKLLLSSMFSMEWLLTGVIINLIMYSSPVFTWNDLDIMILLLKYSINPSNYIISSAFPIFWSLPVSDIFLRLSLWVDET